MRFGERLKVAREERNLTQASLGRLCNTSETSIRNYEKSRRLPDIEMLICLCNALNISPNYLLQDGLSNCFDDETNELLSVLKSLSPNQKDFLMNFIDMLKNNKPVQ